MDGQMRAWTKYHIVWSEQFSTLENSMRSMSVYVRSTVQRETSCEIDTRDENEMKIFCTVHHRIFQFTIASSINTEHRESSTQFNARQRKRRNGSTNHLLRMMHKKSSGISINFVACTMYSSRFVYTYSIHGTQYSNIECAPNTLDYYVSKINERENEEDVAHSGRSRWKSHRLLHIPSLNHPIN